MFGTRLRTLLGVVLLGSLVAAPAAHASSIPLALNDVWVVVENGSRANPMTPGQYFDAGLNTNAASSLGSADSWTFTSAVPVRLRVTDWAIASDTFALYDNGVKFADVNNGTDWNNLNDCAPKTEDCHFTASNQIDQAFADPVFSKGIFILAPGSHVLQFQSTHIPFQEFLFATNPSLQFSPTIAFSAAAVPPVTPSPVPEPGSLVLLGSGFLGAVAHLRRKRSAAL